MRRGGRAVAQGSLGADEVILLPPGDYELRVESEPPYSAPLQLAAEQNLSLVLERSGDRVFHSGDRRPAAYVVCQDAPPARVSQPSATPEAPPAAPESP